MIDILRVFVVFEQLPTLIMPGVSPILHQGSIVFLTSPLSPSGTSIGIQHRLQVLGGGNFSMTSVDQTDALPPKFCVQLTDVYVLEGFYFDPVSLGQVERK